MFPPHRDNTRENGPDSWPSRLSGRRDCWIRRFFVRPIEGQIDDLIGEINAKIDMGQRSLVTTLTKKMAEDLIHEMLGDEPVESVAVFQQFMKIDVLVIVNKTIGIIIEDKVYSTVHDNQIERYKNQFLKPEWFRKEGGRIIATQYDPVDEEVQYE